MKPVDKFIKKVNNWSTFGLFKATEDFTKWTITEVGGNLGEHIVDAYNSHDAIVTDYQPKTETGEVVRVVAPIVAAAWGAYVAAPVVLGALGYTGGATGTVAVSSGTTVGGLVKDFVMGAVKNAGTISDIAGTVGQVTGNKDLDNISDYAKLISNLDGENLDLNNFVNNYKDVNGKTDMNKILKDVFGVVKNNVDLDKLAKETFGLLYDQLTEEQKTALTNEVKNVGKTALKGWFVSNWQKVIGGVLVLVLLIWGLIKLVKK